MQDQLTSCTIVSLPFPFLSCVFFLLLLLLLLFLFSSFSFLSSLVVSSFPLFYFFLSLSPFPFLFRSRNGLWAVFSMRFILAGSGSQMSRSLDSTFFYSGGATPFFFSSHAGQNDGVYWSPVCVFIISFSLGYPLQCMGGTWWDDSGARLRDVGIRPERGG